jgi:hypothetical protein
VSTFSRRQELPVPGIIPPHLDAAAFFEATPLPMKRSYRTQAPFHVLRFPQNIAMLGISNIYLA